MENPNVVESTLCSIASGTVQNAIVEADSVAHELKTSNIGSSQDPNPNYEEHENKRARPWRGRWSYHYNHYSPRTYPHRDNNPNSNPSEGAQNGYYGRGSLSSDRRWANQQPIHNRYTQSRTNHRDDFNHSAQSLGYHGHRYHGWSNNSTAQRRSSVERDKNCANWGNRMSSYDRQQEPWTNDRDGRGRTWARDRQERPIIDGHRQPWISDRDRRGQPWINDRQHRPFVSDNQRQPWTNDRQRQPLMNDIQRQRWSNRSSPYGYHRQCSYGDRQPIPHRSSYVSQNGSRPHRFPAREDSRTFYEGGMVAPIFQACDNLGTEQTKDGNEKLEHEPRQAIETTIVKAPNVCLKKKLLVLDVNGLLADVIFPPPKEDKADININRRAIFKRPFVDDFLKFCFQRFNVAIWSSRTKKILDRVVEYLLGDMQHKLLFCWDQSHCTKTGFKAIENKNKELLLKEIKKVWEKCDGNLSWEKGEYDESNTLLLDDSPYKALLNPMHTAIFPHTYSYKDKSDKSLGSEGDLRVYLQNLAMAENVKRYVEEHPFGQQPIDETCSSWAYYLEVITSQTRVQSQIDTPVQPQMQTPVQPQMQTPVQPQMQTPVQPQMQTHVEPQIQTLVKRQIETPVQCQIRTLVQPQIETPVEPQIRTSVQPHIETPVQPQIQTPVQPQTETPVEPHILIHVEPQIETPVEPQIETSVLPQIEIQVPPQIQTPVEPQIPISLESRIETLVEPHIPTPVQPQIEIPLEPQIQTLVEP